ncbi:hypothetical protein HHI36_005553 [Cryptolaemus montrouzieri]|uniref:Uncharacterized protein n=1 Tax=Cryptolaemus montrouzieri TaxID=559131 RepID=A0ABD2NUD6_9CUCU
MVDNHSHQNITMNNGFRLMPNQIYIVEEAPEMDVPNMPPEIQDNDKLMELKQLCNMNSGLSSLRNAQHLALVQMLLDQAASKRMAIQHILTDPNYAFILNSQNPIPTLEISDSDEDDVIFVKAYPNQNHNEENVDSSGSSSKEEQPRRNPSRNARNKKFRKSNNDENIYEEDFCMLDSSEDESPEEESVSKTPSPEKEIPQNLSVKDLKKWPVNGLHERPEFNVVTQKIEKFDYTIREIQNNAKKPKIEQPKKQKLKKPANKKYAPRKRGSKNRPDQSSNAKVPMNSLGEIVNENYNLLPGFFKILEERKEQGVHICPDAILDSNYSDSENVSSNIAKTGNHNVCLKNYESLIVNQSRLYSLLNEVAFGHVHDLMKNACQRL